MGNTQVTHSKSTTEQTQQLLQQLRRCLKKRLRRRKRCGLVGASTSLLRPMPRCSSFGSSHTLLTPKAKPKAKAKSDGNYAQWKCMFEHAPQLQPLPRPHDISEALSGQTTPRGFPSHTDARRCQLPPPAPPLCELQAQLKVRKRLSFRLPHGHTGSIPRLNARQRAAQQQLEAQLQRDLCDLEDYYGGFHYALRNERRI
ncbi:protein nullo [Drosophila busckii]|uniref:protein nullo n=1 Tax=Drosophila busckii TaxID=30019 RepID=UPI001432DBFB|nr:protein nullo [Drosophila busckii]